MMSRPSSRRADRSSLSRLRCNCTQHHNDVPSNGHYKTPRAGTNAMMHLGAPKGESNHADKTFLANADATLDK